MDREAWWVTVHGVAKSWTQLSDSHTTSLLNIMENVLICKFPLDLTAGFAMAGKPNPMGFPSL